MFRGLKSHKNITFLLRVKLFIDPPKSFSNIMRTNLATKFYHYAACSPHEKTKTFLDQLHELGEKMCFLCQTYSSDGNPSIYLQIQLIDILIILIIFVGSKVKECMKEILYFADDKC
jgi:hypothetical protein